MRRIIPRPILLALTLVLVVGAIALIELRLGAANSSDVQATADPRSTGQREKDDSNGMSQTGEPQRTNETMMEGQRGQAKSSSSPAGDEEMMQEQAKSEMAERIERKESEFQRAKEIVNPSGFINTDSVSINEVRGEKVILLDFWTYSCYNCRNTQPFINRWHEKYADDGLQVVGVHTPEFGFEREYANVERAVREAGIEYPVVLDNAYATWNAYDQRYWPAWYLIDADGFIRYKHFGEGAYGETEAKIKELLTEKERISN